MKIDKIVKGDGNRGQINLRKRLVWTNIQGKCAYHCFNVLVDVFFYYLGKLNIHLGMNQNLQPSLKLRNRL